MRKLLYPAIIIFCILSIISSLKNIFYGEPDYIAPELSHLYHKYLDELDSLGINDYVIRHLDTIAIKEINSLGLRHHNNVFIHPELLKEEGIRLELVFIHEMGHVHGLLHETNSFNIMIDSIPDMSVIRKYGKTDSELLYLLKLHHYNKLKMIRQLNVGDTYKNTRGNKIKILKIEHFRAYLSSDSWASKHWYPIEDILDSLNRGKYTSYKGNKSVSIGVSVYVLRREGIINVKEEFSHPNQCFKVDHPLYNYKVTCIVKDKLDEQGFIIDHELINDTIQGDYFENYINLDNEITSYIKGSCENMHNIIHERIKHLEVFRDNLHILKTNITPAGVPYSAYMEKIWMKDKSTIKLLPLLNS